MRIAIDAMGGDDAPKVIVEGVLLAAEAFLIQRWLCMVMRTRSKSI